MGNLGKTNTTSGEIAFDRYGTSNGIVEMNDGFAKRSAKPNPRNTIGGISPSDG
jgi:hypothetical protein